MNAIPIRPRRTGIYHYTTDTPGVNRTLSVSTDHTVSYSIRDYREHWQILQGTYPLRLTKARNGKYKARCKRGYDGQRIRLTITVIDKDTIDVHILGGKIGIYAIHSKKLHPVKLKQEKRRLIFMDKSEDRVQQTTISQSVNQFKITI